MNNYKTASQLLFTFSSYFILWILLQPFLGYLLDSDCVAYLTIAERVAKGDYFQSINGLWSPLNSWMLAPFIQHGFDAWASAKALNCFFGGAILVAFHHLLLRFEVSKKVYHIYMSILPLIVVYFVYFQMFGDVLQLAFVLFYLLIIFSKSLLNIGKVIACALIMSIGYYAKAYSLFFFFVHFLVICFWLYKSKKINLQKAILYYVTGISVFLLCILPWTFALHHKYKEWSLTGFAGKLNMSWNINSGKSFKPDITLLIPPTYPNSPSFWEDPYITQSNLSSPTSSIAHFTKWIARVVYTTLESVTCMHEISCFTLAALGIGLFYFFFNKKKSEEMDLQYQLLILSILIVPMGYLMMHIETRYIWLITFLSMLLCARLLQTIKNTLWQGIALGSIAISFLLFPIMQLKNLKYKNKDLFEMAQFIQSKNIHGAFTSNATDAGRMWVIAYLTKNPFFTIEKQNYTQEELNLDIKKYHVAYYFFISENNQANIIMQDASMDKVANMDGLDVFKIKDAK